MSESFISSTSSLSLASPCNCSCSVWCIVVSYWISICISLSNVETVSYTYWPFYNLFYHVPIQIFSLFWLRYIFITDLWELILCYVYKFLVGYLYCRILFLSVICLFTLLIVWEHEVLNFVGVQFVKITLVLRLKISDLVQPLHW